MIRRSRFLPILCLLAFTACLGGDRTADVPSATQMPQPTAAPGATGLPSEGASISITAPRDGSEVTPTVTAAPEEGDTEDKKGNEEPRTVKTLTVEVAVEGFKLVKKFGEPGVAGQGHIIYYIWNGFGSDGTAWEVPTALGQPANSGGSGYVAAASEEPSYTWSSPFVRPGRQKLVVQLVSSDHMPLDPPRVAEITVTVAG